MSNTSFELVRELMTEEMLRHLPKGSGWFSEKAVSAEGEVGKLVRVLADGLASWVVAVKTSRRGLMLSSATDEDLDRWGRDLSVARLPGEIDPAYRTRLKKELLRSKVTKNAVRLYVEDITGLNTTVFEPWRHMDIRSSRQPNHTDPVDPIFGRSGSSHRTSTYFQGGVVDIVTDGFHQDIESAALDSLAIGIKPFFTVNVGEDPFPVSFGSQVYIQEIVVESESRADLVQYVAPVRSGAVLRSGKKFHADSTELAYDSVVADTLSSDAQESATMTVVDLFPSIRSVWRTGRSPRSGAAGESGFETLVPYLYGDNLILDDSPDTHDSDVAITHEILGLRRIAPPIVRSASGGRSGGVSILWAAQLERNQLVDQSFETTVQQEGEISQYDLVPSERSVFSLPRSPRSGAPGESAPVSQPFLYGGVEASFGDTEVEFEVLVEREDHNRLSYGDVNSVNRMRSGFEEKVEVGLHLEFFNYGTTKLWDDPELGDMYTFYQTPVTWESNYTDTWDQLIINGHSTQLAADVVIETD